MFKRTRAETRDTNTEELLFVGKLREESKSAQEEVRNHLRDTLGLAGSKQLTKDQRRANLLKILERTSSKFFNIVSSDNAEDQTTKQKEISYAVIIMSDIIERNATSQPLEEQKYKVEEMLSNKNTRDQVSTTKINQKEASIETSKKKFVALRETLINTMEDMFVVHGQIVAKRQAVKNLKDALKMKKEHLTQDQIEELEAERTWLRKKLENSLKKKGGLTDKQIAERIANDDKILKITHKLSVQSKNAQHKDVSELADSMEKLGQDKTGEASVEDEDESMGQTGGHRVQMPVAGATGLSF